MAAHKRAGARRSEDEEDERVREEEMLDSLRSDGLHMREDEARRAGHTAEADALEEDLDDRIRNEDCVLEADIGDARQQADEDMDERRIQEAIEREVEESFSGTAPDARRGRPEPASTGRSLAAQAEELMLQEALHEDLDDRLRDEIDGPSRPEGDEEDEERFARDLQASVAENAALERLGERRAAEDTAAYLDMRQRKPRAGAPPPAPLSPAHGRAAPAATGAK